MRIVNKKLNIQQFNDYLKNKNFGLVQPSSLVIHHTWKPTKAQWKGESSILGLKRYYEGKNWPAGPHLFIAEDGIWLFTDLAEVGIHAGKGNATWKNLATGGLIKGYVSSSRYKLLNYSIGIEVVGNYDNKIWTGQTYKNTLSTIKILMNHLDISKSKIYFHRDFSSKTCPGKAISKNWLNLEIEQFNLGEVLETGNHQVLSYLQVYDFWRKKSPLYTTDAYPNFDAQFKIKNSSVTLTINLDELALAVHDQNNNHLLDLIDPETKTPRKPGNIKLKPKETFHFFFSTAHFNLPGTYKLVAKAKIQNDWHHLASQEFQILRKKRFDDEKSIENMKSILEAIEKKYTYSFGTKLSDTETKKIVDWVKRV
jgi:hypothetical protein